MIASFLVTAKHVLNMLGLVLRNVLMDFLFVRQLYGSSPVEELAGSICRHVLELAVVEHIIASLATAD